MELNLVKTPRPSTGIETKLSKSQLLAGEWSFWYYEKESGKSWEECQHEVASCKSIEEFWILYNSIKLPSDLSNGCDYAFFRSAIRPMWEDENNRDGGRWIIAIDKYLDCNEANRLWLDALLLLIGESLDCSSSICGIVFSNRWKLAKIAIWINTATSETHAIGKELKEKLRLSDSVRCVFEQHHKSEKSEWKALHSTRSNTIIAEIPPQEN